jgi:hypothetical protein
MPSHLMIDIESLDITPESVILSIGIVKFNPTSKGVYDRLLLKPTMEDQTEIYNRSISDDTLRWWSTQSQEAIDAGFSEENRMSLKDCMEVIYHYCWNQDRVWSNGASFDIVMLESAFRQTLTEKPNPIPWPFYTIRDTRTIYEIAGVKLKDKKYGTKTTHNALEDAEHQAIVLQDAYQKLIGLGLSL